MSFLIRLLNLAVWFMMSWSLGSLQCPRKCTCLRTLFSNLSKVKCVGIDQVPTGIPPNTVMLNLSRNSLVSIDEMAFSSLKSLKKIDLSRNRLTFIPKSAFMNLTSLKVVNLKENHIREGFCLPKYVAWINLQKNFLSFGDLKVILEGLTQLRFLAIDGNYGIGPVLTTDIFNGFENMAYISMSHCGLRHIESGVFRAMQNLTYLDLSKNKLSRIQPGALEGPGDQLTVLFLDGNEITTIANATFKRFSNIGGVQLRDNLLTSMPDFTGIKSLSFLNVEENRIQDISLLQESGIEIFGDLSLAHNRISSLPFHLFRKIRVLGRLELAFNKIQSLPEKIFVGYKTLYILNLNLNNINHISRGSFTGLQKLVILFMIKNNLTVIPRDAFAELPNLRHLFLHSNAIKFIEGKQSFSRLHYLNTLTLFDNPLTSLPDDIFDKFTNQTNVAITCKNLRQLPLGRYSSVIKCAPSANFHMFLQSQVIYYKRGFLQSGFVCSTCTLVNSVDRTCKCSFCSVGFHTYDFNDYRAKIGSCQPCPAGGFYQDEMGQIDCKHCSTGTYVSVERSPGRTASDCWACPYGTLSNETAGYRACRCLTGFYRLDRFGACSACPSKGTDCVNDTAILAPNYYWNWTKQSRKEFYTKFVLNIHNFGPDYNERYSRFTSVLPKAIKCPYATSCKGGIDSDCHEGYQGTLCAMCTNGYYLRFNACLQCPGLTVTITSSVIVFALFVLVFLMVLWGDSKKAENDRTVADIIMSCFKIVIGFYQVIAGIFSALARVQWPVALISMEKYLKLFEGNIFQFAPLSCIHSQLRLDQFLRFVLVISVNVFVVSLVFVYLFLKKHHIKGKQDCPCSEKLVAVSGLKKSCYRNIFLFLLASYPVTSKTIIQILPLPGACVTKCFTDDRSQCISLLRADYSIECFTARHKLYWPIASVFALYPLGFPLLIFFLVYKYRDSQAEDEFGFGLKVFYESYKKSFWFWEVTEMYRKLILISLIFLFDSESLSQLGLTVLTVSAFGVGYTFFRPIKDKFEDRLQTFVLWVIFFDVCLGAMYTTHDVSQSHKENESLFVNVLFVVLNSSVLLVALGKGIAHLKSLWNKISMSVIQGVSSLKRRVARCFAVMKRSTAGLESVDLLSSRTQDLI